ncbi:mitochondrial import receptor subunit TOM20 [Dendrobium catenatum]|uniref:Mitochondrial import receptor subunit TOM20 n=1 Tax=Dendrobium catenatum TaxID=906689 RepID=A0A2I0VWN5_9ASPA|nr:mitochondrial import receptor subunit TOM20 [Dendrobium catenatum]PKU67823.1 Mitochondrial import receptor subunit TOM20 [Dendrobium catenatum]
MDLGQIDFDRVLFYEHARMDAEAAYAKNPLDAENLTTWGKALLELSQFQNPSDSLKFVKDAASKMEEALQIDPRKHDALWCLGNAHTSHALFLNDLNAATIYFGKATQCYQQALEEDPGNEIYMKSLEFSAKAPELHMEIHRQMANQPDAGRHSSTSNTKVSKTKAKSDLKYDILGWVILAVGIVAWVGLAKHHIPTPPPAPR